MARQLVAAVQVLDPETTFETRDPEVRLSQNANLPAVQIVEHLDEILGAAAPSAELGD
jgi:hypothetical protein